MADPKTTIEVTITGICVFVPHQQDATLVIPNISTVKGVTFQGEHHHIPAHIPFLDVALPALAISPVIYESPLFSYDYRGVSHRVIDLMFGQLGRAFVFDGEGDFENVPPSLNWTNIVDMAKVISKDPIDSSIVSIFDPRSDRIAGRVTIDCGSIGPKLGSDDYAAFTPPPDPPYQGPFVQEVIWRVGYTGSDPCSLYAIPFGDQGDPDPILTFVPDPNKAETVFTITLGNAPFEDIVRRGTGAGEVIDHHFALYYDLLSEPPAVMRLPTRVSEKRHGARTGAANCPPAIISVR